METLTKIVNRAIEYCFYLIFLLIPLTMAGDTYELFEFNKMWLTFALTLVIAGAWLVKMITQRRISIQRTPLDIPIILFLISQIIATFHSLDTHTSIWGFYSRFNGGLLSIISYIFLYYAFLSNFVVNEGWHRARGDASGGVQRGASSLSSGSLEGAPLDERAAEPRAIVMVKRLLFVSLISGLIVTLWGLPSHFGYDPTCLMLRGNLDVSCWTEAFQPRVRIFSTLGQPNWLAAYLSILIPIAIAFVINVASDTKNVTRKKLLRVTCYVLLVILFYLAFLFTNSRSGFLGLWVGLAFFIAIYIWQTRLINKYKILNTKYLILLFIFIGSITFVVGSPFEQLNKWTLSGLKKSAVSSKQLEVKPQGPALETGGTESGDIRRFVWQGALDIARHNPLFGSGVETFAFAYYQYRPTNHNLTSEWDFLYNKAHNEYLNYLATTGIFGLGSYLIMIGSFLWLIFKNLKSKSLEIGNWKLEIALLSAYLSILVSNFFGFSVVIINLYFFLIPAFAFVLNEQIKPQNPPVSPKEEIKSYQWLAIVILLFVIFYLQFTLLRFWLADKAFALGYNLDRSGQYQEAYPKLQEAVQVRGDEPTFADEFSINSAILAAALANQTDPTIASQAGQQALLLKEQAIALSDDIVLKHPNNVVFWKTRVRMFYALSQTDPKYLAEDLEAVKKASLLAPTDAKIFYNLGLLYGQNGKGRDAISALEKTVKLKPDYRDAYYALGLFYHDLSLDKAKNVVKPELEQKAIESLQYILTNIATDDAQAKQKLLDWRGY